MAQSSAKSDVQCSNVDAPRLRYVLSPEVTPSTRVRNSGLATGHTMVSIAACMMNRKSTGPSHEPCRTPMELSTSESTSPIFTLITAFSWSRMMMFTKWSGRPKRRNIANSASRGTVSNAFTRSMNSAHVPRLCSLRFCSPMIVAKSPSIVPRSERKPTCASMPSSSMTSCILRTIIDDRSLDATSRRQIPRQFLHSDKSPFLGRSTRRAAHHSSYTMPSESSLSGSGSSRTCSRAGSWSRRKPFFQSCTRSAFRQPLAKAAAMVEALLYPSYRVQQAVPGVLGLACCQEIVHSFAFASAIVGAAKSGGGPSGTAPSPGKPPVRQYEFTTSRRNTLVAGSASSVL
mmetsp:Transcript_39565/g.77983  ORF Transcript_39565/g.77983 Transcript_39565/m.77983 type:complete len:345 (-) Transcript_39565:1632-2666(-)